VNVNFSLAIQEFLMNDSTAFFAIALWLFLNVLALIQCSSMMGLRGKIAVLALSLIMGFISLGILFNIG